MAALLPPLPTFPGPGPESGVTSFRALHARYILNRYLEQSLSRPPHLQAQAHVKVAELTRQVATGLPINVGIIGAGAAGLYAAYILEYITSVVPNAGITYEVLEADPKRVGGRLYTHRFRGQKPDDYYDVGAMRFPQGIPYMKRFFDLLPMLGIKTIDYVMKLDQNLNFFNGVLLTDAQVAAAGPDPFQTGVLGLVGSVKTMVNDQIGRFRETLVKNWPEGWEKLMRHDNYSARSYMVLNGDGAPYSPEVVDYLETFDTGTNIYDQALTETVIHSLDFRWPNEKDVHWKCIHAGTQQIAEKMVKALSPGSVKLGQRVTAIKPGESTISVTIANADVQTYDHVITTVPFSCLRTIDTSGCNFPWEVQSAMRMLHYTASTKVAIQFRSRWWEVENGQLGGISKTDRPTRIIVYPSYGIGEETGATMIVSYTWSQDAMRTGAFLGGEPNAKEHLVDLILKDLSDMHRVRIETLKELVIDSHAYEWHNHEFSAGAFALFGPGQFASLYPNVTRPYCKNMFHFAGEAASVHHGWVVGALDSAYRAVHEILHHEHRDDLIKVMEDHFGLLDELSDEIMDMRLDHGL